MMPERESKHPDDHEYRVRVLAAWKAATWLTFPIVFAVIAGTGVGQWISNWAERGFLDGEVWEGFVLTPVLWAAIAAAGAVALYSTVIKWFWDAWDRNVKYVSTEQRPQASDERTQETERR